jgi:uncharacterized membrane protein
VTTRPRALRLVLAAILALAGLVWLGQGLGVLPGGFMSGSMTWAVIGAVCLVAGAALGARELRRA